MSEGIVFGIGGVLFIGTTWATIAFFLSRLNELHRREILESPGVEPIETDTEVYVKTSDGDSPLSSSESLKVPAGVVSQLG